MRNIILSFILTITIGCVTFCTSSKDPAGSPAKAKRNIAIEKAREATKYGPFEPTEDASRLGDSIYRDHKHANDYVAFKDIVLHRPADVAPTPLILRLLDYYNSKRIIDGAYDNIEKWVRYSEDSILANLPKSINRDYDISIIRSENIYIPKRLWTGLNISFARLASTPSFEPHMMTSRTEVMRRKWPKSTISTIMLRTIAY